VKKYRDEYLRGETIDMSTSIAFYQAVNDFGKQVFLVYSVDWQSEGFDISSDLANKFDAYSSLDFFENLLAPKDAVTVTSTPKK
jgi:hypothetical protein